MYAETDFLLALIKDDDWLGEAAETVYREHQDDLWTSQLTLIELLLVAYREERDVERVVANAASLLEVRGDVDTVATAATYVADHGFTPFDALHAGLAATRDEQVLSSEGDYQTVGLDWVPLEPASEE